MGARSPARLPSRLLTCQHHVLPPPRRELACLSMTPSAAVMAGNLKFSSDGLEQAVEPSSAAAAGAAAGGSGAAAGAAAEPAA